VQGEAAENCFSLEMGNISQSTVVKYSPIYSSKEKNEA
jgi:hypothetical protein